MPSFRFAVALFLFVGSSGACCPAFGDELFSEPASERWIQSVSMTGEYDGSPCCSCQSACEPDPGLCGEYAAWKGQLAESGIAFQGNVTQFYFGVTRGGAEQVFKYGGHGDYVVNFDAGKLGIQEGLFLKLRAEHRFGQTVAADTGTFLPPTILANLPVSNSEELYLTNVLFTQALSETFAVYFGKLDTLDGDANAFAHGRGMTQFSNMAFVASSVALRTVPYSTLGAGFLILNEGQPLFNFGVLNATDTTRTSGFDELFEDGAVLTSELRLPTSLFGRPGHVLFGGTWSSRTFVSLGQDPRIILPDVPIATASDSWSLYTNFDHYLVVDECNPARGWGLFGRGGIADDDTNPLHWFLSFGVGGNAMVSSRPNDTFGIGWYYTGTSDEIGPLLTALLGPIGDGQGVELFYNFAVTDCFNVTPDLQVILPAREQFDTALLVGLRANLAF